MNMMRRLASPRDPRVDTEPAGFAAGPRGCAGASLSLNLQPLAGDPAEGAACELLLEAIAQATFASLPAAAVEAIRGRLEPRERYRSAELTIRADEDVHGRALARFDAALARLRVSAGD
jgi:hypothetical protein